LTPSESQSLQKDKVECYDSSRAQRETGFVYKMTYETKLYLDVDTSKVGFDTSQAAEVSAPTFEFPLARRAVSNFAKVLLAIMPAGVFQLPETRQKQNGSPFWSRSLLKSWCGRGVAAPSVWPRLSAKTARSWRVPTCRAHSAARWLLAPAWNEDRPPPPAKQTACCREAGTAGARRTRERPSRRELRPPNDVGLSSAS
jgi:hypothetical protein